MISKEVMALAHTQRQQNPIVFIILKPKKWSNKRVIKEKTYIYKKKKHTFSPHGNFVQVGLGSWWWPPCDSLLCILEAFPNAFFFSLWTLWVVSFWRVESTLNPLRVVVLGVVKFNASLSFGIWFSFLLSTWPMFSLPTVSLHFPLNRNI